MYQGLCFLLHLNRSGSTLLAKSLDTHFNAFVSIEAQFVSRTFKNHAFPLDKAGLKRFTDELETDEKFPFWGITIKDLEARLTNLPLPVPLASVWSIIFEMATEGSQYDWFILKSGKHYRYYDQLRSGFPGSKFLFIKRDPRAVFNSLSKSVNSLTRQVMNNDVARFCAVYLGAMQLVSKHAKQQDFMVVDYDRLVKDEKLIMAEVSAFLDTPMKDGQSNYADRVPENQRHLHTNVAEGTKPTRIIGWKTELEGREIFVIQSLLAKQLKLDGYEPVNLKPTIGDRFYCAVQFARFRYFMLKKH